MAQRDKSGPISWLLDRLSDWAIGLLTKPVSSYSLQIPNDIAALKRHIRKGDVVLVEGNERISECIKYLTQSSWSHSALYVGDEPIRRNPELKAPLVAQYGEEANFLLVEAIVEAGVVLSPLSKYRDFNLRVCRPFNLSAADLADVMDEAIRSVGDTYDLRNVIDLARYFLPVSLVPARFRRQALQFGSGEPTRVICSSFIASAFHRVKFPIVPQLRTIAARRRARAAPPQALADRLAGDDRRLAIRRAQAGLTDAGDAARFRLVALFRDHQIQYYREHAFRLSQDFVGRRHAARAGQEGRLNGNHRTQGNIH